ncbi:hypothetical protein [Steroidobacter gossypii]|uniref:hypothetical protein n=1 Tax=Steroidobacter gossypii TaxID=2805490 RepID=UPI0019346932|nr:hypothetical protein [Steroidobacter gossypii]
MRIVDLVVRCCRAPAGEGRWRRMLIGVSALALLQGCAMNAPSCDGRLEPINVLSSVGMEADTAGDRDRDAGADVGQDMEDRSSQRQAHE